MPCMSIPSFFLHVFIGIPLWGRVAIFLCSFTQSIACIYQHGNYFTVSGENALCFSVPSWTRMLSVPLVSSGLCLHNSSSEDILAYVCVLRSGRRVVLKVIMRFKGRPCIFLSLDDGHLTVWNVNRRMHVMWSSSAKKELSWLSDFTGQSAQADRVRQSLQNYTLIKCLFQWGAFFL